MLICVPLLSFRINFRHLNSKKFKQMIAKPPKYYSRLVVPLNHGHWCIMRKQLFCFIRQHAFLLLTQFGI
jgi:hypothetical protein